MTEKDNVGTRHDSRAKAMGYWMGERLNSTRKDPFVLYTFPSADKARQALLEVPCVHMATDTKNLICTESLFFGCYESDGKIEAVLGGRDLTRELWQKARDSFSKHEGHLKTELEPAISSSSASTKSAHPEKVVFVREERQQDRGETLIYRIHKGPDAESAKAFLKQNPVNRDSYFIVVETPEGNYCRDSQGIYQEG